MNEVEVGQVRVALTEGIIYRIERTTEDGEFAVVKFLKLFPDNPELEGFSPMWRVKAIQQDKVLDEYEESK